ncbi:MAG: efflux RND transporter permease subunit [Candidatus Aminicenantes bacterium]|nr:efflux RND transporter permease subunit [Candidatus Aminicenantes bacterium]
MIKNIIERPVLATIFFVIVILLGAYSLKNTPIELVPDVEEGLPSLKVSYAWPGISPDVMMQKVLIPAEGEIMDIQGVAKISSRALPGSGLLDVEFSRDTRMNFATVILSERLNRLQDTLPTQVMKPNVKPFVPDEFEKKPALEFGVHGENLSIFALKKIVDKEITPFLRSIRGIEEIEVHGGVEPQIKIQTDIDKMKRFDVSIALINRRIRDYYYTKKSVTMTQKGGEITLALSESPGAVLDLQEIVLKSIDSKKLRLKEVADVYLGYEEQRYEHRFNGMPNIGFGIYKEAKFSSMELANKVREKLQFLANRLDGKVQFSLHGDESKKLRKNLLRLAIIAILILFIIFVILIVIVRDVKASILIFSSVFFSVFTTFTMIYLFKIPLNLLTLSGLALGFGLFVDNAVVVFDSILRHRERGVERKKAAVEGAKAVMLPVFSSTLTTIIVFFSFALLFKDRLRIYYLPLAYIITIALLSSIVVSFVLIPSLGSRFKIKVKKKNIRFKKGRFYPFILKYPLCIIIPIIFLLIYSYTTFEDEVSTGGFFSWRSGGSSYVWLSFPSGAEFKDIRKEILKFETLAVSKPFNKEISTSIYPGRASMNITYPEEIEASAYPLQLEQELIGIATNLAGIGIGVGGMSQEPYHYNPNTGTYTPYQIQIRGYNYEKLLKLAYRLKKDLLNHRRIKVVDVQTDKQSWWGAKDKFYSLKLDRKKLKAYRLEPTYLLGIISSVLRESANTEKLKFDDRELSIEIKASDVDEIELSDILDMNLRTFEGIPFRVKNVVTLDLTTQKGGITREDQEYFAMVMWDYLGSAKAGDRHHKAVFKNLTLPVGFSKSEEERRWRMTEEEEHQLLTAILLSFLLIYLILGILYENIIQPILIMLAIPLGLIGVFAAFVKMEYSFTSASYIGIIILSGVVVNNAILLVDNINRHVRKSKDLVQAIVVGTKERIRPIFMTTATTVLGMMPLIILKQKAASSADIWSNLALCTVGGLTTSATFILFVLPIFYYLLYKLQKYVTGFYAGHKAASASSK